MPKIEIRKYIKISLTKSKIIFLFITLIIVALFAFLSVYYYLNIEKIYPGIYVSGFNLSSKTKKEAIDLITKNIKSPEKVTLLAKDVNFELALNDVGFNYNIEEAVNRAYSSYRNGNQLITFLRGPLSITHKINISLQPSVDKNELSEYLQVISNKLSLEPKPPKAYLLEGKVQIDKGEPGESIDKEGFQKTLLSKLSEQDFSATDIPFITNNPVITDSEADTYKKRAESLVNKNIILQHEFDSFTLKSDALMSFLDAKSGYNDTEIENYIKKDLLTRVNREPQNAIFNFKDGKVVEFKPAKNGATINTDLLKKQLHEKISTLEMTDATSQTLDIPIESAPPKITTEQVNDLGIKELIGRGTSKFRGSIPGRIYNIGLASSKINGALIPPGDIFSFNDTVGDISTLTGYKQAYIIKDGRTVLGDGGGVCQVSTTLFRAALNAGLPIVERHAHSYRVGYYEQDSGPGIDATVFSPTSDFKFKNDTTGYLLIQTTYDPNNVTLIFEIYGTADGRVATISKPIITSATAPPEDLYVDDPTLPSGTIKQIDHKAWGAKVNFKYNVTRNGETLIDKTFYSNYQPWQSVFLRGTGPAN